MSLKYAFITGASSGIGKATALQLSQKYSLILMARRKEPLLQLSEDLKKSNPDKNFIPLCLDIQKRDVLKIWAANNSDLLKNIYVLVNAAGLALGLDSFDKNTYEDAETMIDTNFKGLISLTHLLLPYLKSQTQSHIINIGSVAGRWTYPGGAIYCSTKFAVRAFTEGLRLDLMGSPVQVSNIEPGMVETEFSEVRLKDKEKAKAIYTHMNPLNPKDIAECIEWILNRPPHVNIQELVIFPKDQGGVGHVHRHPKA